jgi:hypothetical protein
MLARTPMSMHPRPGDGRKEIAGRHWRMAIRRVALLLAHVSSRMGIQYNRHRR